MKILTAILILFLSTCATIERVPGSETARAERIGEVLKEADKLPDSPAKNWIRSELKACQDGIISSNTEFNNLKAENKKLNESLQKCSDEKSEYAKDAGQMVIFLVVSAIIILILAILLILIRQGVFKTFVKGILPAAPNGDA